MPGESTKVTLFRPASAASPRMAPSHAAGIFQRGHAGGAGLRHPVRPMQQGLDVDADQRRRHQAEVGQRRIAAADVGRIDEGAAEPALAGEPLERRAGIGDRDELRAPAAGALPEVAEEAVALLGGARLARDDEERLRPGRPARPAVRRGDRCCRARGARDGPGPRRTCATAPRARGSSRPCRRARPDRTRRAPHRRRPRGSSPAGPSPCPP